MTVHDYYQQAKSNDYDSLILLIDYLVHERKVLKMEDNADKLSFYLQDKYQAKMNEYLIEYQTNQTVRGA